jgi:hypothetical protein
MDGCCRRLALGSPSDLDYFAKRDAILAALDVAGRDPPRSDAARIPTGTTADDRRWALGQARDAVTAAPRRSSSACRPPGRRGVDAVARDVAAPLREALGA